MVMMDDFNRLLDESTDSILFAQSLPRGVVHDFKMLKMEKQFINDHLVKLSKLSLAEGNADGFTIKHGTVLLLTMMPSLLSIKQSRKFGKPGKNKLNLAKRYLLINFASRWIMPHGLWLDIRRLPISIYAFQILTSLQIC